MPNKFGRRFEEFLLLGRKLFPELPWTDSNDGKILSNVVVQTFHDAVLFFFASLVEFARQFLKLGLLVSVFFERFLESGDSLGDSIDAKRGSTSCGNRKGSFVKPANVAVRPDDSIFNVPTVRSFCDR